MNNNNNYNHHRHANNHQYMHRDGGRRPYNNRFDRPSRRPSNHDRNRMQNDRRRRVRFSDQESNRNRSQSNNTSVPPHYGPPRRPSNINLSAIASSSSSSRSSHDGTASPSPPTAPQLGPFTPLSSLLDANRRRSRYFDLDDS